MGKKRGGLTPIIATRRSPNEFPDEESTERMKLCGIKVLNPLLRFGVLRKPRIQEALVAPEPRPVLKRKRPATLINILKTRHHADDELSESSGFPELPNVRLPA